MAANALRHQPSDCRGEEHAFVVWVGDDKEECLPNDGWLAVRSATIILAKCERKCVKDGREIEPEKHVG